MGTGTQAADEEATRFVPPDGTAALARHAAVPGVNLDGWATSTDAQFHRPLRGLGTMGPTALRLCLPLLRSGDLRIDAGQP